MLPTREFDTHNKLMQNNDKPDNDKPVRFKLEIDLTEAEVAALMDAFRGVLGIQAERPVQAQKDPLSDCVEQTRVVRRYTRYESTPFLPPPGHGVPLPNPTKRLECTVYETVKICPGHHDTRYQWEECVRVSEQPGNL